MYVKNEKMSQPEYSLRRESEVLLELLDVSLEEDDRVAELDQVAVRMLEELVYRFLRFDLRFFEFVQLLYVVLVLDRVQVQVFLDLLGS